MNLKLNTMPRIKKSNLPEARIFFRIKNNSYLAVVEVHKGFFAYKNIYCNNRPVYPGSDTLRDVERKVEAQNFINNMFNLKN